MFFSEQDMKAFYNEQLNPLSIFGNNKKFRLSFLLSGLLSAITFLLFFLIIGFSFKSSYFISLFMLLFLIFFIIAPIRNRIMYKALSLSEYSVKDLFFSKWNPLLKKINKTKLKEKLASNGISSIGQYELLIANYDELLLKEKPVFFVINIGAFLGLALPFVVPIWIQLLKTIKDAEVLFTIFLDVIQIIVYILIILNLLLYFNKTFTIIKYYYIATIQNLMKEIRLEKKLFQSNKETIQNYH